MAADLSVAGTTTVNDLNVTGTLALTTLSLTGDLAVAGATTLDDLLVNGDQAVTGDSAIGGDFAVAGATTLAGDLSVAGTLSLTTVSLAGDLAVAGATTLSDNVLMSADATIGGDLTVVGAATVGTTFGVAGATTLSETLAVTGATTLSSTLGVAGATTLSDTLAVTGAATLSSTLAVAGYTTISDDLVVDGNGGGVANGGGTLAVSDATVIMTADGDSITSNGRGTISLSETEASVTVHDATGDIHGLVVGQTMTTLSGGTNSTTITLDDTGMTLSGSGPGGTARLMGIADGINDTDAVNMRQLEGVGETAYRGIAAVAAIGAIPAPANGKNYSLGIGYGYYERESGIAGGFKANLTEYLSITAGAGWGFDDSVAASAGIGLSW
jgi:hypothetical protein